MTQSERNTLDSIMAAGKKEFLQKGFRGASLRKIAKDAGVTTGAFYGYFASKEALFRALVDEPAKTCLAKFQEAQDTFANLPPESQPKQMGEISGSCIDWMVDYIYENFDAFKLILCCSDGTEYEQFVHTMVIIEEESTHRFLDVLKKTGHHPREIDRQLEHILISGLFSSFFEIVIHDMPKEKSIRYVHELRDFYTAGWKSIMGIP